MDSRSPRDGAVIESIGQYNPMREPLIFTIKEDRLRYWMGVGAQPTDTVKRLVSQHSESVAKEFEKQFKENLKLKKSEVAMWSNLMNKNNLTDPETPSQETETSSMKDLVEYIVKALVDNPNNVEVTEVSTTSTSVIEVKVVQSDAGKVIGREGRIANAIRTLVKSAGGRDNRKINVEIITQ